MARDRDRRKVIWPSYFDIGLSRAEGRRVPKAQSIDNPDIEKLADAAKRLRLDFDMEREKAYPSRWWKREGRLLIDSELPKTELLVKIGKTLKK